MKIIVSTVGTSLITNQISKNNPEDKEFYEFVTSSGNKSEKEMTQVEQSIVDKLVQRAINSLNTKDSQLIRRASAELNGLYGYYNNQIETGKGDLHYLITTDTYQGLQTAKTVQRYLKEKGIENVEIISPPGLSTKNTKTFHEGIKWLIHWASENLSIYSEKQEVIFNLVGGFKSIQGYLNTIGMFYADKIIYIFEAKSADLITIPRLPIKLDSSIFNKYRVEFLLMDESKTFKRSELKDIPDIFLDIDPNDDVMPSAWGLLAWESVKAQLLDSLPILPHLEYSETFKRDFRDKTNNRGEKVKLAQTLAKVSVLFDKRQGLAPHKADGGLQYEVYSNLKEKIGHFRVNQELRVSCSFVETTQTLTLHHYGKEEEVNKNP